MSPGTPRPLWVEILLQRSLQMKALPQPPGAWCLLNLIGEAFPLQGMATPDSAGQGWGNPSSWSNRGQAWQGLLSPMAAMGNRLYRG